MKPVPIPDATKRKFRYNAPRVLPTPEGATVRYVECSACTFRDAIRLPSSTPWSGAACPHCGLRLDVTKVVRKTPGIPNIGKPALP